MMKKICIFLSLCVIFAHSQVANAVAITVNSEPITLYEIEMAMKALKLDRQKAIEALISDRVERSQIKKMGSLVDDFELENEIKKLSGDLDDLKAELAANNKSYDDFKKDFKRQLEKRKLYEAVASGAKVDYSEEGAREYYELHIDEFMLYENIAVSAYTAESAELLESYKENKVKFKGLRQTSEHLSLQNSDPRLIFFLSGVEVGGFSPVLESGDEFVIYEVRAKSRPQKLPYDEIKEQVQSVYTNKQRQDFVKDFFDKAHSKANIVYLR